MARVDTIIVGGGIGPATPFTVGAFPVVVNTDPPLVSDGNIRQDASSPPKVYIGDDGGAGTLVTANATVIGGATLGLNIGPGVIVGTGASATATGAGGTGNVVVLGRNASLTVTAGSVGSAVVIGGTVSVTAGGSQVCIGFGSTISGGGSTPQVAIGGATISSSGGSNLLIGLSNTISGTAATCIAVGGNVTSGSRNITIGGTLNGGSSHVLIGTGAGAMSYSGTGNESVLIAPNAGGLGGGASGGLVVVGAAPTVGTGTTNNVLLGTRVSDSGNSETIVIGARAVSIGANTCVIGGGTGGATGIGTVLIGRGDTHSAAHPVALRFTNATGSNVAIGDFTLTAPRSTGNATPGAIIMQVGQQGAAGAVLQTVVTGLQVQWSGTAADTYLLLYDVDNGTLERVSVGAADSGGVGFKVLRIPN